MHSSFGAKYLKKFDFRGRLGKNEQGIANPVKAHQRGKGSYGLGFRGSEKIENQARNAEEELKEKLQKKQGINNNNKQGKTKNMMDFDLNDMDEDNDSMTEFDENMTKNNNNKNKKRKQKRKILTAFEHLKRKQEKETQYFGITKEESSKPLIYDYTGEFMTVKTMDQVKQRYVYIHFFLLQKN